MKIEGSHTFAASREIVWPMLLDPEVLAGVLPGCEKLEKIGENEYKGILNIRVGPVQGKFNGVVTLSDINAPESYHLSVSGKGAPGFMKGSGSLRLAADDGSTVLEYEGEAQVGGRIASVGQRLLDTSAKAIVRQSLEGLERQVQARVQPAEAEDEDGQQPQPVAAPTQTQFAAGVMKNMFEELVPPEARGDLVNKVLVVVGALFLLLIIDGWRMNRLARKVAKRMK